MKALNTRLVRVWREPHLRWTAIAVAVGLVLRLVWVGVASREPVGLADPLRYLEAARGIASGDGYREFLSGEPTAYYPPGYPYFLGAVVWLARHTPLTDDAVLLAGVCQALIGAATVALSAVLARRLLGPGAGVATAVIIALYPNLIFHSAALLSETLFIALFVAALLVLRWRPWDGGIGWAHLAGFGALFGVAVLVRPVVLAVVPALAVVWWLDSHDVRTTLRRLAVSGVVVVAVVAPWTVRNAVRLDAFVPISTNTGDNFCIGHEPGAQGGFALTEACATGESTADGVAAEVRHDDEVTERAWRYLGENLDREPWLLWRRALITLDSDHDALAAVQSFGEDPFIAERTESLLSALADGAWYLVAATGLAGSFALASRRRPDRLLVVLAAAATLAVPLLFFGDPRFKVPAVPLIAIAASVVFAHAGTLGHRVAPTDRG
ncbi:hypothetical protein BH20ACT2_BH20ACT2_06050 [soil metagenome]